MNIIVVFCQLLIYLRVFGLGLNWLNFSYTPSRKEIRKKELTKQVKSDKIEIKKGGK
jgi:hypothetical protein